MIKLTAILKELGENMDWWVNPAHIIDMNRNKAGSQVSVIIQGGPVTVVQSPEEIVSLIRDWHRSLQP